MLIILCVWYCLYTCGNVLNVWNWTSYLNVPNKTFIQKTPKNIKSSWLCETMLMSHWAQPTMPITLVIESGNAYLTITFRHKSTKTKEKLSSFNIASGIMACCQRAPNYYCTWTMMIDFINQIISNIFWWQFQKINSRICLDMLSAEWQPFY